MKFNCIKFGWWLIIKDKPSDMHVYYLLMESEISVLKVTSLFLNKEIKNI